MGDKRQESYEHLTEREQEILGLIANGLSNQEIAAQLFLTLDTVKWYNSQIYQKLGVRSRIQAITVGRERGLLAQVAPVTSFDLKLELPLQTRIFIGRERELRDIQNTLANTNCRLLTLVGPGGIGKTRLALEGASRFVKHHSKDFPNGIGLVSLQPLNSPDFMVSAIAEAVRFQLLSADNPKRQLLAYLRDKSLLLILDNFEHLLDDAVLMDELLAAAPGIKILATSREALNLQQEWLYTVQGMPYPHDLENLESFEAIRLFKYHAERIRSNFSLAEEAKGVIRICALTEGMPLALELSAKWVRMLVCEEIAVEIEHNLDILETAARNVEPRHRTMRAVFEPTWQHLSDDERSVFMQLSVFRGGFTRQAGEQVARASLRTLSALVDKSLLQVDATGRYNIHELLRQYGHEHLQANTQAWRDANEMHCRFYAGFLAARQFDLKGAREKAAYEEIEIERENVRAYWSWAVEHQKEAEISVVLDCLWRFYDMGSRYQEGKTAFAQAADRLRPQIEKADTRLLFGKVLARQGALTFALDRFSEAIALLTESRHILEAFDAPGDLAFCLRCLSMNIADITDPEWKALVEDNLALCRQIGDLSGVGEALTRLGTVYEYQFKDLDKAIELTQAGRMACSDAGDQRGVATAYSRLAGMTRTQAKYREALDYAQKCLFIFQQLGVVWGIIIAYRECGWAACSLGMLPEAQRHAYYALAASEKYGLVRYTLHTLLLVADLLIEVGETERALMLCALVEETSRNMGSYPHTDALFLKLEHELPPAVYSEVIQQGRSLNFEASVKAILSELKIKISLD